MFFIRGALVWFALMALMFVNGALRELVTEAVVDARTADIAHVVLGCLLIVAAATVFVQSRTTTGFTALLLLGVMWVLMTIALEVVLVLARGEPVTAIAASYDLTAGALWPIIVATVLVSPLIGGLLTRSRHGKGETPAAPASGENGP